jgi:hypothetical protein
VMQFARSSKLKLGSWAFSWGLPAIEAQHWQAAEELRVMGVHGPWYLTRRPVRAPCRYVPSGELLPLPPCRHRYTTAGSNI